MGKFSIQLIEDEIIEHLKEGKKVFIEHTSANDIIINYIFDTTETLKYWGVSRERTVTFITSNAIFPLHVNLSDYDYVDTEYDDNILYVKILNEYQII